MKRRMSRIQALKMLIDRVNKLDKNVRLVTYLSIASIVVSLISIIFAIDASLSCV